MILTSVLSAISVAFFGFILLNLTFLLDFLYQSAIRAIVGNVMLPSPVLHFSFVLVIGLISYSVFLSKLTVLLKAIFLTVPTAVVLVTLGMFLANWPPTAYIVGAVLIAGALYYFHKTHQPWLYYYSVLLVSIVLAVFTLLGGEI